MDYTYLKTRGWLNEATDAGPAGADAFQAPEPAARSHAPPSRAGRARGGFASEAAAAETLGHAATLAGVADFGLSEFDEGWAGHSAQIPVPAPPRGSGLEP